MIEIFAQSYNGQPASADLRCVFGPDGGTFGRGSDNRLPLPDPARHVSRVQGRVRWDGVRYWIANTSDANPMFLNDEELEARRERPLTAGDEIRVGLYVLRVREALDAGVQYRPPPAVQRPAPVAQAAPAAPIQQASIDALVGGGLQNDNPFADLIGGAAGASPPPAPAPARASDPFGDLVGSPATAPMAVAPAPTPINTADPFGDLLGTPSATRPSPAAAPSSAAPVFPQGTIPDDFDPFSAKPSAEAMRNTDDPLRALAEGAVDLGGVAPAATPLSLVDFEPKATRDPLEALGGTPSLVDPHEAVDPMQIFGGDDKLLGAGNESIPPGALPMDDGLGLLDGPFNPGQSIPDPLAPVAAPRPAPDRPPAPPPAPPPPQPTAFAGDATMIAPPRELAPVAPPPPVERPVVVERPAPVERPVPVERAVAVERPSAPPADMKKLVDAFLEGAGVPEGGLAREITPEAMRELGTLVYQAVAGAMSLIAVRQITKREIGAELTMIVATRNNPLKFLPTPEAAVMQILGPRMPGFMAPTDSMADAFDDLRAHEVGVIAGTRAAFTEVLRRFDPKELEQRLGKGGLLDGILPGHRDAKLWELFVARFQEVYKDAQDDFDSLYGLAFTQAYEAEVRRARAERRR